MVGGGRADALESRPARLERRYVAPVVPGADARNSLEAVEGTDAALRRAAALCGRGLVIAKAAKPDQDLRFDRPAIGPATIQLLSEIGAAMIGVESGQALILERPRTLAAATDAGITIWGDAGEGGGERSDG